MYPHSNHIPQPPHSAGLDYKGLRPRIDPGQVPSPIDAIENDRLTWENQAFMTLPGTHAPLCTSDFIAVDQGNSSPKFIRVSTWNLPSTSKLAHDCHIPLAAVFQPFAELDPREEPIPLIETSPAGPVRCGKCRGYINPWCTWVSGGVRWKCNLCRHETEVNADYFCNLDANMLRLDHLQRPELNKGTVDFSVPEEYWAQNPPPRLSLPYVPIGPPPSGSRPPAPLNYIFAFDVTINAIDSGFLHAACASVQNILFGGSLAPCFPPNSRIAIVTFDNTLHFYDLSSGLTSMMVVGDIDEVFVPLRTGMFVNPSEYRSTIESLLASLPNRFTEMPSRTSALGSLIRGGLAALAGRGGHVIIFQGTMPTIGPGALPTQPNETDLYDTEKEKNMHKPRDKTWLDIGEECAEEGVGVSLFVAPASYIDLGSIGVVATMTGGEIFFHPRFKLERDGAVFDSQLQRVIRRPQGYNCMFRVRTSNGIRITRHYGNFFKRSPTDLELGILDADKSIFVSLEHSGSLDPRTNAHIQCATLYTTIEGQRRVRVCNLALNVVELAGNVFQYADMETTVGHFAREAMAHLSSQRMSIIRDDLTEKCSTLLLGYRNQCAAATRSSQLIIPEAFRALPAFTLALQKSKPLKARHVSSDVRNYEIHRMMSMPTRTLIHHLYPRLLPLHDLENTTALPQTLEILNGTPTTRTPYPSCTRDSHYFMENGGLYMIDNEETVIFWISSSTPPKLLADLFGEEDIMSIPSNTHHLPTIDSLLSRQIHNILADRYAHGGRLMKMYVARQNLDAIEIEFSDMLVEDQNNGAMSYVDYLAIIHRQITTVLTHGGSIEGGPGMRGSPW